MNVEEIRKSIDQIDDKLVNLYLERMALVEEIVEAKKQSNVAINDPDREKKILLRVMEKVDLDKQIYVKRLFETLFETSKAMQTAKKEQKSLMVEEIIKKLESEEKTFPIVAKVACQGVEGAYSGIAAERLFEVADVTYFKNFDNVFSAVEKGFCKYGILPIENSTAGSVNEVYDLMQEHKFTIVRSVRLPIVHCLVAKDGVNKRDIKEIVSHEQALNQCKKYLEENFPNAKITTYSNTALAGRYVSECDRKDIATLCSKECAEKYGLKLLEQGVQDSDGNYTRFILITKDLEIYTGANKISVMTTLPHAPGSLYKMLGKFANLGVNLTKLESRPIAKASFEFTFYFDFECDIRSNQIQNLLSELDSSAEKFTFLGAYSEIL